MSLIDIILPKECIFCSKVGDHICERCLRNIPKSLPRCFQCGKISEDGKLHNSCDVFKYDIRYIKGWDLEKREIFESQKCIGFFSPYMEMLLNIVKRYNIKESYLGEKVLPIMASNKIENELNKYLAKSLQGRKKDSITFIGEGVQSQESLLKQIEKERKHYNAILVITIF